MMKQFAASSGLAEDQLAKGMDMFAGLDDSKLDMVVNTMQTVQKAKDVWTSVNAKTGGHLMKILILLFVLVAWLLVQKLFFSTSTSGIQPPTKMNIPVKQAVTMEDEFDSEF